MAKNVTIAGASYSDVPAVDLPQTGGGTATFTDVSDTTAQAADVATGKQFFDALGVLTQGTASGGGGASNVVTGTFKGTTTGSILDIDLPYTGSGFPIAVVVYATEGAYAAPDGNFYNTIKRFATWMTVFVKGNMSLSPTYDVNGDANKAVFTCLYKSSSSTATSYSFSDVNNYFFYNNSSPDTSLIIKMKSSTQLSVLIAAYNRNGFAANVEYTYHVIYSS